jgi:hypothetical protein
VVLWEKTGKRGKTRSQHRCENLVYQPACHPPHWIIMSAAHIHCCWCSERLFVDVKHHGTLPASSAGWFHYWLHMQLCTCKLCINSRLRGTHIQPIPYHCCTVWCWANLIDDTGKYCTFSFKSVISRLSGLAWNLTNVGIPVHDQVRYTSPGLTWVPNG